LLTVTKPVLTSLHNTIKYVEFNAMDLENLYSDKKLSTVNKKSFLKFVSSLQLIGGVIELYTVKAAATGAKLIETVSKK